MARGDDGPGLPPWLEHEHHDRKRIIDEVLKRADFGVRPYARVSQMVRTYPTFAERLREEIAKRAKRAPAGSVIGKIVSEQKRDHEAKAHGPRPISSKQHRLFAKSASPMTAPWDDPTFKRRLVREIMRRLSPSEGDRPDRENILLFLNDTVKRVRKQEKLDALHTREALEGQPVDQLSGLRKRDGPRAQREAGRAQMRTLKQLYEAGGPLCPYPTGEEPERVHDGRDSVFPLMPYPPGDARRKLWLNLWREPDGDATPPDVMKYDLRLFWEGYYPSQNISAWEDWDEDFEPRAGSSSSEPASHFWYEAEGKRTIDSNHVALDALVKRLERYERKRFLKQSFHWSGALLSVSHLWCLPASIALQLDADTINEAAAAFSLTAGPDFTDEAAQSVIEAAKAFGARAFPQTDQTRKNTSRDDLVMSLIGAGEAILICDFRPFSRDKTNRERAARAIILNLTMDSDKTGRMIRRLLDIAAYRNEALRDYQYSFEIRDVISDVSATLSRDETDGFTEFGTVDLYDLEDQLDKLLALSASVAAANQFVNGGVTGFAATACEKQALIDKRLGDLREFPIPGRQSLRGYLRRFDAAIDFIETVRTKYVTVRERIDEMVNLTRAELARREASNNAGRTLVALIISGALLFFSGSTALAPEDGPIATLEESACSVLTSTQAVAQVSSWLCDNPWDLHGPLTAILFAVFTALALFLLRIKGICRSIKNARQSLLRRAR